MPTRFIDPFLKILGLKGEDRTNAWFWAAFAFLIYLNITKDDKCAIEVKRVTDENKELRAGKRYSDSVAIKVVIDSKNEVLQNNKMKDSINVVLAKSNTALQTALDKLNKR